MGAFGLALYRALGAGIAIAVMELLAGVAHEPLHRVPFVTSIVLAMALPDSEPAQPRAIITGHMIACAVGYIVMFVFGTGELPSAVAVALATLAMIGSRSLHPPAGINAFLVASHGLPVAWAVNPVLIGAVMLAVFALFWRALERRLFLPSEREAAPKLWSLSRLKQRMKARH